MEVRTKMGRFVTGNGMSCGWTKDIGTYALAAAVNALAADGMGCDAVEARILFPAHADNLKAYAMEKFLRKACLERGIEQVAAQIQSSPLAALPVVTVLAGGTAPDGGRQHSCMEGARGKMVCKESAELQNVHAGDAVVLVKWIGIEGMLRIADEKGDELRQRFAPVFIRQIQSWRRELFAGKELEIARRVGVSCVRQITEGGILAALWNLAKDTGCGLDLDMKRISVLQETIEVCEQYRLNPYQLTSAGSFLMVTADVKALTDALYENQIHASLIGRLTAGNDKIIHNGEDVRYLDRPAPDEIYKILL